jgi:hypothetical protein
MKNIYRTFEDNTVNFIVNFACSQSKNTSVNGCLAFYGSHWPGLHQSF